MNPLTTKTCSTCQARHPITEFCRDVANQDGLSRRCKTCRMTANKKYLAVKNNGKTINKNRSEAIRKRNEAMAKNRRLEREAQAQKQQDLMAHRSMAQPNRTNLLAQPTLTLGHPAYQRNSGLKHIASAGLRC